MTPTPDNDRHPDADGTAPTRFDPSDVRPLNAALREAVDFVHAEGWDRPATLFALVPSALVADALAGGLDDDRPLALVVEDGVPEHVRPGSEELGEFIATVRWPEPVVGAVLAQEIVFRNAAEGDDATPRQARLFSGVLDGGADNTLVQLRPTPEELEADPFAQDRVQLLGGEDLAPGVIAALRATFGD
ncbi:PPA1309 family protein [Corynebacterium bovis]|uniref:PPA1309 family protein n=1 Tax=Corynebacterium bovis TaxID=36808 RepID=UPI00254ABBB9|nr:PPA1309 family protein [Corynebacterium bovis]MDK8511130.1 PPA1309 family protein [Corynebacterium bovis]